MNAVSPAYAAARVCGSDHAGGLLLDTPVALGLESQPVRAKGEEAVPPPAHESEDPHHRGYQPISVKARLVAGLVALGTSALLLIAELCMFETVSSSAAGALAAAKAVPAASTVAARELRRAKGG